jgi:hypothetical protein
MSLHYRGLISPGCTNVRCTCVDYRSCAAPGLVTTTGACDLYGSCLHDRDLSCTLRCLDNSLCWSGRVYMIHHSLTGCSLLDFIHDSARSRSWAAPGRVWVTGACVAPGRVYTTGAWTSGIWTYNIYTASYRACAEPGRILTKWASAAPGRFCCTLGLCGRVYTTGSWASPRHAGKRKVCLDLAFWRAGCFI